MGCTVWGNWQVVSCLGLSLLNYQFSQHGFYISFMRCWENLGQALWGQRVSSVSISCDDKEFCYNCLKLFIVTVELA